MKVANLNLKVSNIFLQLSKYNPIRQHYKLEYGNAIKRNTARQKNGCGSHLLGDAEPDSWKVIHIYKYARVSLMKHAGMIVDLERKLRRPVDLVTDGTLLPFAVESANRDKILIYERAS